MQFFRLILSMNLFCLLATLSGCSEGDQGTGRLTQMRCAQDGLCAEKVGTRSLELGFREGDKEIRADVIYRRYGSQLQSNRPYAVRMFDQDGGVFISGNSGGNPDGWTDDLRKVYENSERSVEQSQSALVFRNDMLQRMLDAMQAQGKPDHVDQQPWQEAYEQASSFCQSRHRPAKANENVGAMELRDGRPVPVDSSKYVHVDGDNDDEKEVSVDWDEQDEDARDELDAHLDAEIQEREEDVSIDESWLKKVRNVTHFGSFDGLKKKHIDYTEHHEDPAYEYKQELALWNLNTKTFFVAGWASKKHHSAAIISLFRRPIGSNAEWEPAGVVLTRNHGSKPGDKRMHPYARCTDLPITKGYYNWKGECDGVWLTGHLCNDDTAYQVWHAYGGWNGGRHCIGKKRTKRPSCAKPW